MTNERMGDWIETYTGKEFYPYDPRPEEVDIRDIAHALAHICRFNGHTKYHYSVAQHSVYCAELAKRRGYSTAIQLYALLHDAAEAYICDIPRPLKPSFTGYDLLEARLQSTIILALGLPAVFVDKHIIMDVVKGIDADMLNLEGLALMPVARWAEQRDCAGIQIDVMSPYGAEQRFLFLYQSLKKREDKHEQ
jgi:hypothetical protein